MSFGLKDENLRMLKYEWMTPAPGKYLPRENSAIPFLVFWSREALERMAVRRIWAHKSGLTSENASNCEWSWAKSSGLKADAAPGADFLGCKIFLKQILVTRKILENPEIIFSPRNFVKNQKSKIAEKSKSRFKRFLYKNLFRQKYLWKKF